VTERNRLTEEGDRLFIPSMDMLCNVHLDGEFQRVNPVFEKVLGFSEDVVAVIRSSDPSAGRM